MNKGLRLLPAAILTILAGCVKPEPTPPPTPPEVKVTSVTVSPATLSIVEGESQQLKATVLPSDATNPKVTWTSSNAQVASVTDGTVKALKPGTATITATADGKQGTCTVTVTAKIIPTSGVTLDITATSLDEGQTVTLTATIVPADATDKSVSWSSSAPDVASVDQNGKVTAIKKGSATITATAGGKSATCEVTVIARVASVSLDKATLTMKDGEEQTLTATILPENADDKSVSWSSSAPDVASVDQNGKVTAIKKGTATITVTTVDGGKTATCEVTVIARVASVSLDKTALTMKVGEEKALTATVLPENAEEKSVSWSSSAPDVASVDQNGKVTAIKPGTANITVKTADGGKTAVCAVTVQAASGGTEDFGDGGGYGNNDF